MEGRPSRSSVTRAGDVLRRAADPLAVDEASFMAAREVLQAWRRAHGTALHTARETLRSKVDRLNLPRNVTQRLKETPTVIAKLRANPQMGLGNMQDIAGCRAVVPGIQDAYDLAGSWDNLRVGELKRTFDRIADPQESGYRGIHLQVAYEGLKVEVQIRTEIQNHWADLVEKIGPLIGHDLKRGYGPPGLLQSLAGYADSLYEIDNSGVESEAVARSNVAFERVFTDVENILGLEGGSA